MFSARMHSPLLRNAHVCCARYGSMYDPPSLDPAIISAPFASVLCEETLQVAQFVA